MTNTLKTLGLRGLSSVSTLIFTFLATNFYGLKEVGSFAIFLAVSSFIYFLVKFGMELPLFVDLTNNDDFKKMSILNEYKNLQNKIFVLFTIISFPIGYFFNFDNLFLMYITGFFMSKTIINAFAIRSLGHQNIFVLLQNGNANFFGILFLCIFQIFPMENSIITSFFLGNIFLFFLSHISLKFLFDFNRTFDDKLESIGSKKIISNSFVYLCIDMVNNIFTWTPLLVIYFLFSEIEQGIFLNIAKLGSVFIILLFILETIVMKDLAEMANKGLFSSIKKLVKYPKNQMIVLSFIIFGVFIIFGNEILSIINSNLYGYKFDLLLYSASQILVLLFGPLALFMKVSDNQIIMRNIVILSSFFNIIISFTFGYYFGLSGIFISAILGNLFWCFITLIFIDKKYGISF